MKEYNLNGTIFRETMFENYYITNDGDIAQIEFKNNKLKKFFLLEHIISDFGHHRVEINNKKYLIHRLVYQTWSENELRKDMVIDHKDANPHNNHISNLIQTTQKGNIQNAIEHGNFGHNHNTKLEVYDSITNTTTIYNSIKDFLIAIKAPDYIIKHGGLSNLKKRKEYKRYSCRKINEH